MIEIYGQSEKKLIDRLREEMNRLSIRMQAINNFSDAEIFKLFLKLPEKYKNIITKRFVLNESVDSLSEAEGVGPETIRQRIKTGVRILILLAEDDSHIALLDLPTGIYNTLIKYKVRNIRQLLEFIKLKNNLPRGISQEALSKIIQKLVEQGLIEGEQ